MAIFDSLKGLDLTRPPERIGPTDPGIGASATNPIVTQPNEDTFFNPKAEPPMIPPSVAGQVPAGTADMTNVNRAQMIGRIALLASLLTGGATLPIAGMAAGASGAMTSQKRQAIMDAMKQRQAELAGQSTEARTKLTQAQTEALQNPSTEMTEYQKAQVDWRNKMLEIQKSHLKAIEARQQQQATADKMFAAELAKVKDPKVRMRMLFQWKATSGQSGMFGGAPVSEDLLGSAFPEETGPQIGEEQTPGGTPSMAFGLGEFSPTEGGGTPEEAGPPPEAIKALMGAGPGKVIRIGESRWGIRNGKLTKLTAAEAKKK